MSILHRIFSHIQSDSASSSYAESAECLANQNKNKNNKKTSHAKSFLISLCARSMPVRYICQKMTRCNLSKLSSSVAARKNKFKQVINSLKSDNFKPFNDENGLDQVTKTKLFFKFASTKECALYLSQSFSETNKSEANKSEANKSEANKSQFHNALKALKGLNDSSITEIIKELKSINKGAFEPLLNLKSDGTLTSDDTLTSDEINSLFNIATKIDDADIDVTIIKGDKNETRQTTLTYGEEGEGEDHHNTTSTQSQQKTTVLYPEEGKT